MRPTKSCHSATAVRLALVLITLSMLVGGCGSSSSSSHGDVFTGAGQTNATATPGSAANATGTTTATTSSAIPGLKPVGTITKSGDGTTFSEQVSMGPIGYGSSAAPPADVLSACDPNFSRDISSDAYIHGQLTFNYGMGTVPATAIISESQPLDSIQGGPGVTAALILYHDGAWDCSDASGSSGPTSLIFQPGQATTDEFWIDIGPVVTNAHPQYTQNELKAIYFNVYPMLDQTTSTTTVAGPDAVDCGSGPILIPFSQSPPPFTVTGTDGTPAETCQAPGSGAASQTST